MQSTESLTYGELVAQISDGRTDFSHSLFTDRISLTHLGILIENNGIKELVFDGSEFLNSVRIASWCINSCRNLTARLSLRNIKCHANIHLEELGINKIELSGAEVAGKTVIQYCSGSADLTGLQTDGLLVIHPKGLSVNLDQVRSRTTIVAEIRCRIVSQLDSSLGDRKISLGEFTNRDTKWELLPVT